MARAVHRQQRCPLLVERGSWIGRRGRHRAKRLAWDERGLEARLELSGAAVGVALFGGQAAGVAALGTAIGVPLRVVSGSGAAFAGVLYKEIAGRIPSAKIIYTIKPKPLSEFDQSRVRSYWSVMHKLIVLLAAMLLSAPCLAKECATTRLDAEIIKADADGEANARALLDRLAKARGMSKQDAAIYYGAMLSRDEPRIAQGIRDAAAAKLATATASGRCADIKIAKKMALAVIISQWNAVDREIEKDMPVDKI